MSENGECGHVTFGPQNIRGRCNNKAIGVADGLPHCGVHDPNRPDKVKRRAEAEARFERRCAPDPRDGEIASLRERLREAEAKLRSFYEQDHRLNEALKARADAAEADARACADHLENVIYLGHPMPPEIAAAVERWRTK